MQAQDRGREHSEIAAEQGKLRAKTRVEKMRGLNRSKAPEKTKEGVSVNEKQTDENRETRAEKNR